MMRRVRLSLRGRFLLATFALVAVLCAAFAVAVNGFVEMLEDELLPRTLARQMQQFKEDIARHPDDAPPSGDGLDGYVVRGPADQASLPEKVARLSNGMHKRVSIGGREYYVAVDDVQQARLYLLLDKQRVEAAERSVVTDSVLLGFVALGLATLVGWVLARAVMSPVTALANEVAGLDPRGRGERLGTRFEDQEVGLIARAFDHYMERLERVREREQAFTEDASHELRTPLAIITSASELLTEDPSLSQAARERLLRVRRASGQMQSLIEALLFLARGEPNTPAQAYALDQIVRDAAEGIVAAAAAKSLEVVVDVEPVIASGVPAMAACVVNNLLLNAVNFTQSGRIQVKLTSAELAVCDTGVGISPQDLTRIFERRYRGEQSRGLGLGLYLVSRICERLGWRIEADSAPGRGTTFRILLGGHTVLPRAESANKRERL
jgi:signal transduction histidine kinase